jgi:hypothetical protein
MAGEALAREVVDGVVHEVVADSDGRGAGGEGLLERCDDALAPLGLGLGQQPPPTLDWFDVAGVDDDTPAEAEAT